MLPIKVWHVQESDTGLTHASRATIWRWEKKYAWALGVEEPLPGEEEEGGTAGE